LLVTTVLFPEGGIKAMNNSDVDVRQQFKAEADEFLFAHLQFDSRMKAQVMHRVLADQKLPLRKGSPQRSWRKWIYGTISAAAIMGFLLFSSPLLDDEIALPDIPGQVTPLNGPINDAPTILKGDPVTPLITNGQDDPVMQNWLMKSTDEASKWFGEDIAAPSYIPSPFGLDAIHATGQEEGIATEVTMSYVSGNQSFAFSQRKQDKASEFLDYKTIDIHGIDGFMKVDTSNIIEIQWFADRIQYTVVGMISEDEALRVARSIQ
jgi:hypothetical protein